MGEPLGAKQIKIAASPPVFNKKTGTYISRLTLINRTKKKSKQTFLGPLGLVVTGATRPDVSLANAEGHTSAGLGYVTVSLPTRGLKPGKSVKNIRLAFANPSRKKFKPTYSVYIGMASSANFGTNSGAIGVLALNNARIAFVPVGTRIAPVVLEGSGTPTVSGGKSSAFGPINSATTATDVNLSFSADSCTVDMAALKVVCVGFRSTTIAILDVSKYIGTLSPTDIGVTEFDSGAPDVALRFSGGRCVLCGVAADPGDNRYIVAANDAYRVYAYNATSASAVYAIPINENFSYDTARNRIIAAEYEEGSGGTRAFNIVDLAKNKVYRWTGDTASCAELGYRSRLCGARKEVDSTAVDLTTGIAGLIFEHTTAVAMIDLGQAVFDESALTFTAPAYFTEGAPEPSQSAGVASTTGNYLFSAEELGPSDVGVMRMPSSSGAGGVFPTVTPNPVYIKLRTTANPECGSGSTSYLFRTKGDPHGLALYTGLINGKQTGLVVDDDNECAALVDLEALFNAPRDASDSTQVDSSIDLRASGIVRFVKLQ